MAQFLTDTNPNLKYDHSLRSAPIVRVWRHYDQTLLESTPQYSPQNLLSCPSQRQVSSGFCNNPTQRLHPSFDSCQYDCITIERTRSGNSILSSSLSEPLPTIEKLPIYQQHDLAAAARVENWFRRRPPDSKHERILRKLIRRDEPLHSGFTLDDAALESILTAVDTIFFDGALAGRVQWEWSSEPRYRTELIGTTALRRCVGRNGFETLIVLSEPVLRDERYDRRLLLSAFLHELIHCYLFISCGFEARMEGGHTAGFYRIAKVIDSWVGPRYLSIYKLREDPERFHIQKY